MSKNKNLHEKKTIDTPTIQSYHPWDGTGISPYHKPLVLYVPMVCFKAGGQKPEFDTTNIHTYERLWSFFELLIQQFEKPSCIIDKPLSRKRKKKPGEEDEDDDEDYESGVSVLNDDAMRSIPIAKRLEYTLYPGRDVKPPKKAYPCGPPQALSKYERVIAHFEVHFILSISVSFLEGWV